jgi:ParB family chromosome partitioning protein
MVIKVKTAELIKDISLEDLLPNPYQPASRIQVDPETANKFGLSIKEHGLIQTPVVRPGKDSKYEIGDGWLRRAGFLCNLQEFGLQEYAKMPCVVRKLTDQQMADMVMEANTVRKDLNPIELAMFYKRYLEDFKVPQVELARRHNCSQGEIANTIRLLELPADIQGKIISQEISETHGRQLLRLNYNPALQQEVLKDTIEENISVSHLSNKIGTQIYWNSENIDPDDYRQPSFDIKGCEGCPNRQKLGDPYSKDKKTWRCIDKACFQKKTDEAEKERVAQLNAEIQAAKGKANQKKAKGKEEGVIDISGLTWRDYQELDSNIHKIDNPDQCKTCPNRAVAKFSVARVGPACLDVKCFKEKEKIYQGKEAAKSRELEKQLTERVKAACEQASNDGTTFKIIIDHLLLHSRKDTRDRFSKMYELPDAKSCFPVDNEAQMIKRIAAMVVMIERYEGEKGLFYKMLADLEDTGAEMEKQITAFQEAHCKTCEHGGHDCRTLMRVFPDGKCYAYYKKKKETKGKSEDEEIKESLPCKDCQNGPTCDRTFFYTDGQGGLTCDNKHRADNAEAI